MNSLTNTEVAIGIIVLAFIFFAAKAFFSKDQAPDSADGSESAAPEGADPADPQRGGGGGGPKPTR
jgi:hypothetical protein